MASVARPNRAVAQRVLPLEHGSTLNDSAIVSAGSEASFPRTKRPLFAFSEPRSTGFGRAAPTTASAARSRSAGSAPKSDT